MNSRGCNPRWAHSNGEPTLKGSNYGERAGRKFGPARAGDIFARPTVGCTHGYSR